MVLKSFYLVGQDEDMYHQEIHIDQFHDFENLRLAVASHYNIVVPGGIRFQSKNGDDLSDLDAIIDNDDTIGITVDGNPIRDPSGPTGLPFFGSYYQVFPDHLGNHSRLFETYGSVIHYDTMGKQNYLTNDPNVMSVTFNESYFFSKIINTDHPLSSIKHDGALFIGDTDTEGWRLAHKFIPPAMSPKAVRHYTPMMQQTVEESFPVFDQLDEKGEAWNVYQYMLKLASTTVFKFALGYQSKQFATVDSPIDPLVDLFAHQLSLTKKVANHGSWYRSLAAIPGTVPAELKRMTAEIHAVVVNSMENAPPGSSEENLPLQTAALYASCIVDYLKRAADDKGNKLPLDYIVPNMVVICGAGFTTTSSLLSWLIYSLCVYPGIQDKLIQELVDAGVTETTTWTPELYESLHYQEKFIKETQRRHNPSFQPGRTAKVDCIIPGGYKIPQGAVIINALHAMHNNPKVWSNPDKFDPDRWDTEEVKNRPKNSYIPFATGPRGCIGFNFALGEIKVLLPALLYRYEFSKEGDEAIQYDPDFQLIRPINLYVRAKKRTSWPKPTANGKEPV